MAACVASTHLPNWKTTSLLRTIPSSSRAIRSTAAGSSRSCLDLDAQPRRRPASARRSRLDLVELLLRARGAAAGPRAARTSTGTATSASESIAIGSVRWRKSAGRDTAPAMHAPPARGHFSAVARGLACSAAMTFALARSLLLADAVTPDALAAGAPRRGDARDVARARAPGDPRDRRPCASSSSSTAGDAPYMRHVAPVMALVQHLPPGLCERLLALPVRRDPRTGTVDVAVVDARDPHPVEEIGPLAPGAGPDGAHLDRRRWTPRSGASTRSPRTGCAPLAAPIWVPPPRPARPQDLSKTPAYGSPVFDETRLVDPTDDSQPHRRHRLPAWPIRTSPSPCTRKSLAPIASSSSERRPSALAEPEPIDLRERPHRPAEAAARAEPVLDLRRRKSSGAHPARTPPRLPSPTSATVLDAIRDATDRDAILELLVAGTRTVARKVAVLAVRRDALVGLDVLARARRPRRRCARRASSPAMSDVLTRRSGLRHARARCASPRTRRTRRCSPLMEPTPSAEVALVAGARRGQGRRPGARRRARRHDASPPRRMRTCAHARRRGARAAAAREAQVG